MSYPALFTLLSIFFAGLLALGLKIQSIKVGPVQVDRVKFPVIYWLGVGFHVFVIALCIGAAIASGLSNT